MKRCFLWFFVVMFVFFGGVGVVFSGGGAAVQGTEGMYPALIAFDCKAAKSVAQLGKVIEEHTFAMFLVKQNLEKSNKGLLWVMGRYRGHRVCSREEYVERMALEALREKIALGERAVREYELRMEQLRLCSFRIELSDLLRRKDFSKSERAVLLRLQKISRHFVAGESGKIGAVARNHRAFFEGLSRHYWKKKRLGVNACRVLRQTYRVWSSFYESENRLSRKVLPFERKIPVYSSNGHNDSYRLWSWEAQKGRIPRKGLTIVHLDSHPDMGGYLDRSPGHWSDRVLDLQELHQALRLGRKKDLLSYMKGRWAKGRLRGLSVAEVGARKELLREKSFVQLRRDLRLEIPRRVHYIAHPLTAAVYARMTRKLVLCMPPWSQRFGDGRFHPKTKKSEGLELMLIRELKTEEIFFGVLGRWVGHPWVKDSDMPSYLEYDFVKKKYERMPYKIEFHVTRCTRDDLSVVGGRGEALVGLSSYFRAREEGKDGFLLGFDLDVFSTNGDKDDIYVVPRSYGRTTSLKSHAHKGHDKKSGMLGPEQISEKEYKLLKLRVDDVFARLKGAKKEGYLPRIISIADSTSLGRVFLDGVHSSAMGGGDYVPGCLAFLLNAQVKSRLRKIYSIPF